MIMVGRCYYLLPSGGLQSDYKSAVELIAPSSSRYTVLKCIIRVGKQKSQDCLWRNNNRMATVLTLYTQQS